MYINRLVLLFIVGAYLLSPAIIEWWSEGGRLGIAPTLFGWPLSVFHSGLVVATIFPMASSNDDVRDTLPP